jgi:hypothetical protein
MPEERTALDVARIVADALERAGMPYAIGGAIALAFYATPRATVDVDLNVFVSPDEELDRLLALLAETGFVPGSAGSPRAWRRTVSGARVGSSRRRLRPCDPLLRRAESRRRMVTLLGRPLWILGAEDLTVLEMMFFRRKDLADVEAILRDRGASLDRAYVRRRLGELAGEDGERAAAWDELDREVEP